jgi:hypothetical protein
MRSEASLRQAQYLHCDSLVLVLLATPFPLDWAEFSPRLYADGLKHKRAVE